MNMSHSIVCTDQTIRGRLVEFAAQQESVRRRAATEAAGEAWALSPSLSGSLSGGASAGATGSAQSEGSADVAEDLDENGDSGGGESKRSSASASASRVTTLPMYPVCVCWYTDGTKDTLHLQVCSPSCAA